jgi:hypothetical protein
MGVASNLNKEMILATQLANSAGDTKQRAVLPETQDGHRSAPILK